MMLIHTMVHSMINLTEQTQGTALLFAPQSTKFTLSQPCCATNNSIQQTQMRLCRRHNTPGWTKHINWSSSWAHVDNQITFLRGARHHSDSWLPSSQLTANESQTSTHSLRLPQEFEESLPPQTQPSKSKVTIPMSIGPKSSNHHRLCLLQIELHMPLQTPGVDCAKSLLGNSITWGRDCGLEMSA